MFLILPITFRYRYKDGGHNERGRDFERDRDFHRDNRGFSRERDFRDRERDGNNTDYHYYGNNDGFNKQDNRGRNKASHWGQGAIHREGYYPPQQQDMQVPPPYRYFHNCFIQLNYVCRLLLLMCNRIYYLMRCVMFLLCLYIFKGFVIVVNKVVFILSKMKMIEPKPINPSSCVIN